MAQGFATIPARSDADRRSTWRAVAIPAEHGGWGLTLEPVVLGLLLAPSLGGGALGVAAFLAFLVRTPLKLALVDRRRHRWLDRSRAAARVAATELVLIALLVAVALATSDVAWVVPVLVAVPLVAVELWYDVRSRGRRLVPELCGAVGIASVAAAIVLAGGGAAGLAVGAWLVLAGRAAGSIPYVRAEIARLHGRTAGEAARRIGQLAGVALAAAAVVLERSLWGGLVAVAALFLLQLRWHRRPPVPAKVLGFRQLAGGVTVVVLTAIGAWLA